MNYSTSICPFVSGKCGKEGKKLQKLEYLENEKSFLDVIKNTFHSFWRAIIWWKNKKLKKIADKSFKEHLWWLLRFKELLGKKTVQLYTNDVHKKLITEISKVKIGTVRKLIKKVFKLIDMCYSLRNLMPFKQNLLNYGKKLQQKQKFQIPWGI